MTPRKTGTRKWMTWMLLAALLTGPALGFSGSLKAQCSICTKTTQQLGEKPARGMNGGILYLAFAPIIIVGYIGYRWMQSNHETT